MAAAYQIEPDTFFQMEDLPGLHIHYGNPHAVHAIFDGIDLIIEPDLLGIYLIEGGSTFRHLLADRIRGEYQNSQSWRRCDSFCHLMAVKIWRKLQRLPQTSVWLLHYL